MDEESKGNWIAMIPVIGIVVFFCLYVLSMVVG